ncbi:MAG: O-antigen ligase family protein [Candidatus Promineifilaceae bacterium]
MQTSPLQRAYHYSWLSLILLYPIIFFITPARSVVLLWLPLLAGWRWLAHGRPIPKTPYNPAILLLTLMVAVSAVVTPDFVFSLPKIAGLLFGIATFYVVLDVNRLAEQQVGTVGVLLLLCGVFTLIGFANFYPPIAFRLPAALRLEVNPNEVSGILTYSLPLLLALTVWQFQQQGKTAGQAQFMHALLAGVMSIASLIGLLILYLTTSRGGQVACLVAAGLIAVLCTRRFRLLMAGVAVVLLIAVGVYFAQVDSAETTQAHANATLQITLTNRIELWSRGVMGIQDFPLTGMGMNLFRRVMPTLYPLEGVSAEEDLAHAHNHLLQAALDLGLPGLFAYLALWVFSALQLTRVWHNTTQPQLRFLALGLGASLLAHFLFGMTDAIALGAKPGFLLWILFGLAAALPAYAATETTGEIFVS